MSEASELYEALSKTYAGLEAVDPDFEFTILCVEFEPKAVDRVPREHVTEHVETYFAIRDLQGLFEDSIHAGNLLGATLAVTCGRNQSCHGGSQRRVLHFEISVESIGEFRDDSFEGRALKIAADNAVVPGDSTRSFPLLEFLGDAGTEESDPSDFYAPGDN